MENKQNTDLNIVRRIRQDLLNNLLVIAAILGFPAIVVAEIEAFYLDQTYALIIYPFSYSLALFATIFRKKLNFYVATSLLLLAAYIIAVYNLYVYGFSGAAIPLFFTIFVLATVFMGLKAGFIFIILSSLPMIIIAILMIEGILEVGVDLEAITSAPIAWITAIVSLLFLGSIMIIAYGVIHKKLINSYKELNAKNEELEKINMILKKDIEKREKIEKQLIKAKKKAEESDQLKTAFLMNMSHEIRTPMNGIMGFTSLLQDPDLTKKEKNEYLEIIRNSGKRMLNIINSLINISKIEAGQEEVENKKIDLEECMRELQMEFGSNVRSGDLDIVYEGEGKDSIIETDETKFMQVMTNLISNAVKFTPSGEIRFGYNTNNDRVHFFVKDTGIGISEKEQNIIFEPFRQADQNLSSGYEGAGLGLSISSAYVELLGGKLSVDSTQGAGSKFHFSLPISKKVSI